MNCKQAILNLYKPDTRYGDSLLQPQRWCHRQWSHLSAPLAPTGYRCFEVAKRVGLFVVLLLATIPSYLVTIPGALFKAYQNQPQPYMHTISLEFTDKGLRIPFSKLQVAQKEKWLQVPDLVSRVFEFLDPEDCRTLMQVNQPVHAVWQTRVFSVIAERYLESGFHNADITFNERASLNFLEAAFYFHPERTNLFKNKREFKRTEISSLNSSVFQEIREQLLIRTHLNYQWWFEKDGAYLAIATSMKGSFRAFNAIPRLDVSNIPAITTELMRTSERYYVNPQGLYRGYIQPSDVIFFALRLHLEYGENIAQDGRDRKVSIALVFTKNRSNAWNQEGNEMFQEGQINLKYPEDLKGIVELLEPKKDLSSLQSQRLLSLFKSAGRTPRWLGVPMDCVEVRLCGPSDSGVL
jgi:hypothetical protein